MRENNINNSGYSTLREKIKQKIYSFKEKSTDLVQTNYKLGLFHLNKNNILDSILRLRLVLFLKKDHLLAKYYLAICKYLTNKSQEATTLLEEIKSSDKTLQYPEDLLKFFKDLSLPTQYDKNLTRELWNTLIDENSDSKDMAPAYQILTNLIKNNIADPEQSINLLDIGCGSGKCFEFLKSTIIINKSIGVDFSEKAIDAVTKQQLYTETSCQDFELFLETTQDSFDLIILDSVLHYYKNFTAQLEQAKKRLTQNGVIAFIVEQSPKAIPVTFNHSLSNFSYNKNYIIDILNTSKVKLSKIEICNVKNKNLYICLCTKVL